MGGARAGALAIFEVVAQGLLLGKPREDLFE
jgi:hypothetical protein